MWWGHKIEDLACDIIEAVLPEIPSKMSGAARREYDHSYDLLYDFMMVLGKLDLVDYD